MGARKTPILLRRAPLSGGINALTNYRWKTVGETVLLEATSTGKHDVTADFDALVCEHLLDPDSPDIAAILDGVAAGQLLTKDEKVQVAGFRERLVTILERHNSTGHGSPRETEARAR